MRLNFRMNVSVCVLVGVYTYVNACILSCAVLLVCMCIYVFLTKCVFVPRGEFNANKSGFGIYF